MIRQFTNSLIYFWQVFDNCAGLCAVLFEISQDGVSHASNHLVTKLEQKL